MIKVRCGIYLGQDVSECRLRRFVHAERSILNEPVSRIKMMGLCEYKRARGDLVRYRDML